MRLFLTIWVFLFLISITSCRGQDINTESGFDQIDKIVTTAIEEKGIPSFAIGIVKDGDVVYSKTFGLADVEASISAYNQTVYQLGSVTKTFVGLVLSNLIEKGKISLSDPLSEFFPDSLDFPKGPTGEGITVQHIATHSAGFPRYPANLERVDPEPILGFSKEDLYKGIELVKTETGPGTDYHYSNFGYGVLGIAMENATKMSLNELMSTYIFDPLGMKHTVLQLNDKIRKKLATPYLEVDPYKKTQPWQMGSLSGAGNVFSTLDDMNALMLFLLEQNEVNKIQQQSYLPINDSWSYGLGCFVIASQKQKTKIIYHGGDVDGYASSLTLYPEYDLGFTILTNYGDGEVVGEIFTKIGNMITDTFLTKTDN